MRLKVINLVLLVPWLLASCGGGDSEKTTPLPTIPVRTIIAQPGTIEVTREFSGGLEGIKQAALIIRLSEAVTNLPHKIGDQVKQGEVLIYLDRSGASSQYFQAKAMSENAEKNYLKMKNLFAEKAISEVAFDQAEAAFEVAKANFKAAKELVEITSPIDGVVVELNVKIGDIPAVGTLAAQVARTESLRMSFGVPAEIVSRFAPGMIGELRVSSDDTGCSCTVSKVSDAADPTTRTFDIELSIPNPDRRLQPGVFGKAHFVIDRKENVIKLPQASLLSNEGVFSVYVVKNDTAYSRTVGTGILNGVNAEIVSGLTAGEEVVVVGQNFLSGGYPIVRSKQ